MPYHSAAPALSPGPAAWTVLHPQRMQYLVSWCPFFTISSNFLQRYCDLIGLLKLAVGLMFYIVPHGGREMFRPVDLGRLRARPQPSARDSFPLVTYGFLQRRTKGRPSGRLHSDAQVNQQETPKTLHLRIGAPCMAI